MGIERELLPKYQLVVRTVNRLCNAQRTKNSRMADVASNVIFALWRIGGFEWDMAHIRNFTLLAIRRALWVKRATFLASEAVGFDDEDGDAFERLCGRVPPAQETYVEAQMALRLLVHLEPRERLALLILADGGSPLDVAEELETDAIGAMLLIKSARRKIQLKINPVAKEMVA